MSNKYDYLIVGAGVTGSVFARLATDHGFKVIIIEKNEFSGGHCSDEKKEDIFISKFGPHIFHCPDELTWDFVNQFSKFNSFSLRTKVNYENSIYSFPINLMTLYQLWGITTPQEAKDKILSKIIPHENPSNFEELALSLMGQELYDIFYRGYTKKQWGTEPHNLPTFIFKRTPIRFNFNDYYFKDDQIYCGMPNNGYSGFFENLLNDIEIKYNTNYLLEQESFNSIANIIIYTGSIDELLNFKFGKLDYLSLRFENERIEGDFQGNPIINYTSDNVPYTRIMEWKHFYNLSDLNYSYITKEFPARYEDTNIPYYPINISKNQKLYQRYLEDLKAKKQNIILKGRLAEYKYLNMNDIVLDILKYWGK